MEVIWLKKLSQFTIILFVYFIGQALQILLNLPIPGTVLGLMLMLICLCTGIIKVEMIEEACDFLLSNMSFFFIPAGVGLITSFNKLEENWIPFLIILLVSTIAVWIATYITAIFFRKGKLDE